MLGILLYTSQPKNEPKSGDKFFLYNWKSGGLLMVSVFYYMRLSMRLILQTYYFFLDKDG